MKMKYICVVLLLLFARGCDFYSTSLWFFQEGGMEGEMNPLTRYFNVGWNGLVTVNVIVITGVAALFFYYCFRFTPKINAVSEPGSWREYASLLYFNRPDQFYKMLYRTPVNWKPAYAHLGYVLTYSIIFISFLVTIHNLCQFYQVGFYDTFRSIVRRPHFVIIVLSFSFILLTYRRLILREFHSYERDLVTDKQEQS